jgi:hypothetical protein
MTLPDRYAEIWKVTAGFRIECPGIEDIDESPDPAVNDEREE